MQEEMEKSKFLHKQTKYGQHKRARQTTHITESDDANVWNLYAFFYFQKQKKKKKLK